MGRWSARAGVLSIFLVTLFLAAHADVLHAGRTIIRIKGSNIMAAAVDNLARSFTSRNRDYTIVVSGGGTQAGFNALLERGCEIATTSRRMSDHEREVARKRGLDVKERLVGREGIAIVVNPANPVQSLTMDQVRNIFNGKYSVWSQVGGPENLIILFSTKLNRSGTAVYFKYSCLKGDKIALDTNTKYYFDHVIREVSRLPEAVGFSPFVKAIPAQRSGKIRMLSLKWDKESPPVPPTTAAVTNRTYPLIMPLYFYYVDRSGGKITRFVDYCAGRGLALY